MIALFGVISSGDSVAACLCGSSLAASLAASFVPHSAAPVSTGAPTRFPHSVQEPS